MMPDDDSQDERIGQADGEHLGDDLAHRLPVKEGIG
jgi:hypothetical protein